MPRAPGDTSGDGARRLLDAPGRAPAYRLETERLVLRCWQPMDAPLLLAAIAESLEHLRPWMPWAKDEPQPVETKVDRIRGWRAAFDRGEDLVYGIFESGEGRVLGGCGLHPRRGAGCLEIGYWVHSGALRQGLASEAAGALARAAFEVQGMRRVEIRCDPDNQGSRGVARRLGFAEEGILRLGGEDARGAPRDTLVSAMLARDYAGSPLARRPLAAFDVLGRVIRLAGPSVC